MDTGTGGWSRSRKHGESNGTPASVARALLALGLRLEIDASEPRAGDVIPVGPGEPLPHYGAGDSVRFPWLDAPAPTLRSGVRVRLELEDLTTVPARVQATDDAGVELLTPMWLGRPVPGGRIVEDARWIQQSLRRAMLSSLRGRYDRLALNLLGVGPVRLGTPEAIEPRDVAGLNPEQVEVVSCGLRAGVTYVLGPPGTGKSKALGALVGAALRSGRTVACVAPSNRATDRLLDKLCGTLAARGALSEGLVVRLGPISLGHVEEQWGRVVDPWSIAVERFGPSGDPSLIRAEHDRLVERCQVLVTTAARTHLKDLKRRFELVVIDEAATAPLPLAYHVATLARNEGSLVVCGDPFQLPVVTRSRHPQARMFYGQDLLFRAGGLGGDAGLEADVAVIKLRTQYRCDSDIADLVAGPIYGGDLHTHESVLNRPDLGWPDGAASLALLDTSGIQAASRRVRRYGNVVHARAIADLIRRIRSSAGGQGVGIAVLARYRDQVATIRECIQADSFTTVSTVHAMQGGEADIVVLDLSACPEHDFLGDYLQDSAPDGVGARLLNTAITRARRRLVVVADVPFILGHPEVSEDAMARRVLKHLEGHALPLSP